MTTLPNMGLELPTRGPAGSGTWDDTLDANATKVDAHDHTVGAGARIRVAALDIDSDVSFGSVWAPVNLHHITLASILISPTPPPTKSIYVNSTDNELYFRNNSGNSIKITAGNTLNVAAFVGGIGGDYTAVAASVAFDDSQKRYTFKDGSANWARGVFGGVRLIEQGTAETVYVGLIAPSALAASYTLTMPAALPGAQLLLQLDTAGNILTSNTVPGAVSVGGDLTVGGAATIGANKDLTVSGIGVVRHGPRTVISTPWSGDINQVSGTPVGVTGGQVGVVIPATCNVYIRGPQLPACGSPGARLISYTVLLSAAVTLPIGAFSITHTPAAGAGTAFPLAGSPTGAGTASSFSANVGTQFVDGTTGYWINYANSGGPTFSVIGIVFVYDNPP